MLATGAGCAALLGVTAASAQSDPSGPPVCGVGWYGTMTFEDALVRYAGYYTEQEIIDGFAARDVNGNGFVCVNRPAFDRNAPLQFILDDVEKGRALDAPPR
jgi:hypothetical protein